jgi:hypothetical protein
MRILIPLLLLGMATLTAAATLTTGDGLALDLSAQGRVTGVRIGSTALPARGEGGFAIYDFAVKPELINLVPNGSFEEGATGWRLGAGQTLDATMAHTGKASARLEVPGPEPAKSNLEVVVPVKPNTTYVAELWVRRHGVGVCGAYVSERDDANKLTGPVTQMGVSIPKQDDVWLPLKWKLTTQPKTTRLSFRGDIYNSTGTLWLDDFMLAEAKEGDYRPVTGKVTATGNGATFAGGLADAGLEVQAKLTGDKECLRVEGTVQDSTGRDRAIGLRFSVPLDAAGWTWGDDAGDQREVKPATVYRNTYNCQSGLGECSIYPWSAVSALASAAAAPGLSLALPLAQGPRVFIIQQDQGAAELSITFFFGLSKLSGTHPSRAPFTFMLYRHDARWGMRSAMERAYRLFAESFTRRPTFEGYLNYANLERPEPSDHTLRIGKSSLPDVNDFGEGYKFLTHVHGCYDYRQIPWPSPKMMTDEEVITELQKMVAAEGDKGRYYVPTAETIKKICRGPEGQLLYIGDTHYWRAQEGYNHTDQPGWGLNFRVDEDPALSPHLMNVSRQKAEEYAKTTHRPWDATFTADAIEGYMSNTSALDFAPEHLKTTLQPLTFGKESLKPALVNTIWDFLSQAWWPITGEHKIVTYGNANCYEQAFTLPYVDLPMTEGSWDPRRPARLDRYLRGMAHHKIWRYWHAWDEGGGYGDKNPAYVRAQMQRGLASGIYPSVYSVEVMAGNLESYRALFRQHIPALEELNYAGWEPVPYAETGADLTVERFGGFAEGELHFTVRNWGDKAATGTLRLDRAGLGLPGGADLLSLALLPGTADFQPVPAGGLPLSLAAGDTTALWIGTKTQAVQHGFRLAGRVLEKLDRTFYTEMDDNAKALWQQALGLAQQGQKAEGQQALILAEGLQNALGNLQEGLKTKSPVDLAKLIYRARVYASMAPTVALDVGVRSGRLAEGAARGATIAVPATLQAPQRDALSRFQWRILSPWAEVAAASQVILRPEGAADAAEMFVKLAIPAEPARALLPFLVEARGTLAGTAFSVYAPVDVVPGSPVSLTVQPRRVFRGQDRKLVLTFASAVNDAGTLKVKLPAPPRTVFEPAEFTVSLPPRGRVEQPVTLKLEPLTFLGDTRVNYAITSDQAQFNTRDSFEVLVSDPVPQVPVKQTTAPPVIDGKLTEALWQAPPLIPELKILADGSPATEKTAVWMAYDQQGIYVALRCRESQMSKLVAKYSQRGDPLYLDDDVEVFIMPTEASRVYQFAVNALGTQSDNFGNKADWRASAQRGADEWTVEAYIPFAALELPGPPAAGLPWGMQFGRQQKAKRETTSWTAGAAFISKESLGEVVFE